MKTISMNRKPNLTSNISKSKYLNNNAFTNLNSFKMATNLEVIVGTYEQFLLGYKVEQVNQQTNFISLIHLIGIFSIYYRMAINIPFINRLLFMLTLHRYERFMQKENI